MLSLNLGQSCLVHRGTLAGIRVFYRKNSCSKESFWATAALPTHPPPLPSLLPLHHETKRRNRDSCLNMVGFRHRSLCQGSRGITFNPLDSSTLGVSDQKNSVLQYSPLLPIFFSFWIFNHYISWVSYSKWIWVLSMAQMTLKQQVINTDINMHL